LKDLAVLIPFKANEPKSRLSEVLTPPERRAFVRVLLLDVISAVRSAGLIRSCYVISSDPEALSLARDVGAMGLLEPSDRGVDSAVRFGMSKARSHRAVMVIPSDLPLLEPRELAEAIWLMSKGMDVVISPSASFDGTNLLLFKRPARFRLSYDADSFWSHLAGAARSRLSTAVYCGRGLTFDVDSPADLLNLGRLRINRRSALFARKVLDHASPD
jgi:2-phospho-L-lactate/phosphoenolpyruvate guanylyltransferase